MDDMTSHELVQTEAWHDQTDISTGGRGDCVLMWRYDFGGCIHCKCRISMLHVVSPHFSDCNAYVKGLLIMVGWPKKKLTRYKYQTLLSISPNQHFRACALTEVLCLQGASCFQGSTSSKFYPRTAGRAYFCHLLRGNLSTIQRKQAPTPNSYIFS